MLHDNLRLSSKHTVSQLRRGFAGRKGFARSAGFLEPARKALKWKLDRSASSSLTREYELLLKSEVHRFHPRLRYIPVPRMKQRHDSELRDCISHRAAHVG